MSKEAMENSFLLVYASQTGQAKAIAEEILEHAPLHGFQADLHCISKTEKRFSLERTPCVVFVASTTGDGEPPETSLKFWRRLKKRTLPNSYLEHLKFTLLGLGDSNYTQFCTFGRMLDRRLAELGARRFYPCAWADDAVGLEQAAEPWMDGLWPALKNVLCESVKSSDPVRDFSENVKEDVRTNCNSLNGGHGSEDGQVIQPRFNTITSNESIIPDGINGNVAKYIPVNGIMDGEVYEESDRCHNSLDSSVNDNKVNGKEVDEANNYKSGFSGTDRTNVCKEVKISNTLSAHMSVQDDLLKPDNNRSCVKTIANKLPANTALKNTNPSELDGTLVLESLTTSLHPLSDSVLTLPLCPEPYLDVVWKPDEDINITDLSWQNGCPLPLCKSDVFHVPIASAARMTRHDAVKSTIRIQLDISDTSLIYEAGDSFGILCSNHPAEVTSLIQRLGLAEKAECVYSLQIKPHTKKRNPTIPPHLHRRATLRHIFLTCVDIRAVPKKTLLRALVEYTANPGEKRRLQELCSKQGTAHYTRWIREPALSLMDILMAFHSCRPPIEILLEHLGRLQPRLYSAASCPTLAPGRVQFVFNVVEIPGEDGRHCRRRGVCTGWLEKLTQNLHTSLEKPDLSAAISRLELKDQPKLLEQLQGEGMLPEILCSMKTSCSRLVMSEVLCLYIQIPLFLRSVQNFHTASNMEVPIVMIGPGVGVAPFVGFLQHRETLMTGPTPPNLAESWLFFGCRHRARDYIFKTELEEFVRKGVLSSLFVSFSRDEQPPDAPRYVQDNMRQQGARLVQLLYEENAYVFVCGDAGNMVKDVKETFTNLLVEHRGMTRKNAEDFLLGMRQQKRYLEDVWT